MSNNPYDFSVNTNSLEELWMPFTPNRQFKKNPRMIMSADGMYYKDQHGKEILDCTAGLWCVNAGHNKQRIKDAISAQMRTLDYAPCFNLGHPAAFMAASRLTAAFPDGFDHVFFSNSGSEAVDTALKIALVYQRIRGKGTKRVLIGRERSYHGVGFGGISVGGVPYVRTSFSQLLPLVDHMPHTHNMEHNAFSKNEPEWGAHLANELENIVALHDASNIAAVIVEPVAGAPGVLPPPKGYLKRIREICTKHDILLIFDEVVTGFGRVGYMSASDYFGVVPDMIVTAKGLTNAVVPMGATFVNNEIYNAFMQGDEKVTEFLHGYTYSAHPLACAAAIATLDVFEEEGILNHARSITQYYEDAAHSLKGYPYVTDIRNLGLLAAVQLQEWKPEDPYRVAREVSFELFRRGVFIRFNGINMIISPPLIMTKDHIDTMFTALGDVLHWAHKEFG
jgi:beta-alanine--pyruvate transaminase